jgi:hypothetical protein
MAGETGEVSGIGVKLTLDASGFMGGIESASGQLNKLQAQAQKAGSGAGQMKAGGGKQAASGVTGTGTSVGVNLTVSAAQLRQLRSEITSGLGAIPVTITPRFATSGPQSIQNIMGSMLSMQYGASPAVGRRIAKQAIDQFVPKAPTPRAYGGPVQANRDYLVGERRAEVFRPRTSGSIHPDAARYYREEEQRARQEASEYRRHQDRMRRMAGGPVDSTYRIYPISGKVSHPDHHLESKIVLDRRRVREGDEPMWFQPWHGDTGRAIDHLGRLRDWNNGKPAGRIKHFWVPNEAGGSRVDAERLNAERRMVGGPTEPQGPLQRRMAGLPPLERPQVQVVEQRPVEPEWIRRARQSRLPYRETRHSGGPVAARFGLRSVTRSYPNATVDLSASSRRDRLRIGDELVDLARDYPHTARSMKTIRSVSDREMRRTSSLVYGQPISSFGPKDTFGLTTSKVSQRRPSMFINAAYSDEDVRRIGAYPQNIVEGVRHEFGHAVDYSNGIMQNQILGTGIQQLGKVSPYGAHPREHFAELFTAYRRGALTGMDASVFDSIKLIDRAKVARMAGGPVGKVETALTRRERSYTANVRAAADRLSPEVLQAGREWYPGAEKWIAGVAAKYGKSEPMVRGMAAALSAGTSWRANKAKLLNILDADANGGSFPYPDTIGADGKARGLNAHRVAKRILEGQDPQESLGHTPKTWPFFQNTGGDLEALTLDRWAFRTGTLGAIEKYGKGPVRTGVDRAFRKVAREQGVHPVELQAALWIQEKYERDLAKYDEKIAAGHKKAKRPTIAQYMRRGGDVWRGDYGILGMSRPAMDIVGPPMAELPRVVENMFREQGPQGRAGQLWDAVLSGRVPGGMQGLAWQHMPREIKPHMAGGPVQAFGGTWLKGNDPIGHPLTKLKKAGKPYAVNLPGQKKEMVAGRLEYDSISGRGKGTLDEALAAIEAHNLTAGEGPAITYMHGKPPPVADVAVRGMPLYLGSRVSLDGAETTAADPGSYRREAHIYLDSIDREAGTAVVRVGSGVGQGGRKQTVRIDQLEAKDYRGYRNPDYVEALRANEMAQQRLNAIVDPGSGRKDKKSPAYATAKQAADEAAARERALRPQGDFDHSLWDPDGENPLEARAAEEEYAAFNGATPGQIKVGRYSARTSRTTAGPLQHRQVADDSRWESMFYAQGWKTPTGQHVRYPAARRDDIEAAFEEQNAGLGGPADTSVPLKEERPKPWTEWKAKKIPKGHVGAGSWFLGTRAAGPQYPKPGDFENLGSSSEEFAQKEGPAIWEAAADEDPGSRHYHGPGSYSGPFLSREAAEAEGARRYGADHGFDTIQPKVAKTPKASKPAREQSPSPDTRVGISYLGTNARGAKAGSRQEWVPDGYNAYFYPRARTYDLVGPDGTTTQFADSDAFHAHIAKLHDELGEASTPRHLRADTGRDSEPVRDVPQHEAPEVIAHAAIANAALERRAAREADEQARVVAAQAEAKLADEQSPMVPARPVGYPRTAEQLVTERAERMSRERAAESRKQMEGMGLFTVTRRHRKDGGWSLRPGGIHTGLRGDRFHSAPPNAPAKQLRARLNDAGYSSQHPGVDLAGLASEMMGAWTGSATNDTSALTQLAAAEEFGIGKGRYRDRYDRDRGARMRILREAHTQTQEMLRKQKIREVDLYRGARMPEDFVLGEETQIYDQSPLTSWTTDPKTAQYFAYSRNTKGKKPVVLSARVPASRILSGPHTGFGAAGENEFVILGSPTGMDFVSAYEPSDKRLLKRRTPFSRRAAGGPAGEGLYIVNEVGPEAFIEQRDIAKLARNRPDILSRVPHAADGARTGMIDKPAWGLFSPQKDGIIVRREDAHEALHAVRAQDGIRADQDRAGGGPLWTPGRQAGPQPELLVAPSQRRRMTDEEAQVAAANNLAAAMARAAATIDGAAQRTGHAFAAVGTELHRFQGPVQQGLADLGGQPGLGFVAGGVAPGLVTDPYRVEQAGIPAPSQASAQALDLARRGVRSGSPRRYRAEQGVGGRFNAASGPGETLYGGAPGEGIMFPETTRQAAAAAVSAAGLPTYQTPAGPKNPRGFTLEGEPHFHTEESDQPGGYHDRVAQPANIDEALAQNKARKEARTAGVDSNGRPKGKGLIAGVAMTGGKLTGAAYRKARDELKGYGMDEATIATMIGPGAENLDHIEHLSGPGMSNLAHARKMGQIKREMEGGDTEVQDVLTTARERVAGSASLMAERNPKGVAAVLGALGLGGGMEFKRKQARFQSATTELRKAGRGEEKAQANVDMWQANVDYEDNTAEDAAIATKQLAIAQSILGKKTNEVTAASEKFVKAEDDLIPSLADTARNFAGIMIGTTLYAKGLEALGFVMQGVTPGVKDMVDMFLGFGPNLTKVSGVMGDSMRQMGGNYQAAFAATAVTAGWSNATSDWAKNGLQATVTAKAGAKAYGDLSEIFRAAMGAYNKQGTEGLYGGYGGLMGGPLFGSQLGGGKGLTEQMIQDINRSRGDTGIDWLKYGSAAAGGNLSPLINDVVTGQFGVSAGSLPSKPGQAETAITDQIDAAMKRAQGRDQGPGYKIEYRGQAAADAYKNAQLPQMAKNLGAVGYAVVDSAGNITSSLEDVNKALEQFATGLTIPDVETWAATMERQVNAQFQMIDIQGAITRGLIIPMQFATQRIQNPVTAPGAGTVPGAGLTGTLIASMTRMGVPTGQVTDAYAQQSQAFLGTPTAQGGLGLSQQGAALGASWMKDAFDIQAQQIRKDQAALGTAYTQILNQPSAEQALSDSTTVNAPATITPWSGGSTQSNPDVTLLAPREEGQGGLLTPSTPVPPTGSMPSQRDAWWQEMPGQMNPAVSQAQTSGASNKAQADQYMGLMASAQKASTELKGLQGTLSDLSAAASKASWANTTRLSLRGIADATNMLTKGAKAAGGELGTVQRALWDVSRKSQALDLQLRQRQITTQLALAQFQAPGETGEERYFRQKESITKAGIEQRQLGYSKETYALTGQEWKIQAQRNLVDAQEAWKAAQKAHEAEVLAGIAQAKIAALSSQIASDLAAADSILSDSTTKSGVALSAAKTYVENFGDKIAATLTPLGNFGNTLGASAKGMEAFLKALGFTFKTNQNGTTTVTGPTINGQAGASTTTQATTNAGPRATGMIGSFSTPTTATFGEAASETVAILRNPRTHSIAPEVGGGGPTSVTVNINGASVRNDNDISSLARQVAVEVERSLSRKGQMFGLRGPSV